VSISTHQERTYLPRLAFQVFHGLDGLRALEHVWTRILESIARPEFFFQYAWYKTALTTWAEEAENTYFIVAYRDQVPVAVCPLQMIRTRATGVPIRVLSPPDPHGVSYSDFVCSRDAHPDLLTSLIEELRTSDQLRWDLLILPKCFDTAAVAPNSQRVADTTGVMAYPWDVCFYFPCDQDMDSLYARMRPRQRRDLRKCGKRLAQLGKVEFVWTRDPKQLPHLFDQFLSIEASGWKGAKGTGTAIKLNATLVHFYSTLMREFGEAGNCEINLLRVDGRNIAGDFALLANGTWNQLKIGYDEDFAKLSPGYLLLEGIFARLCDDPRVRSANILTGAEWAARLRGLELQVWRVVARNGTARGRLAFQGTKLRRWLRDRVIQRARSSRTDSEARSESAARSEIQTPPVAHGG
jgi:CelD/BcsL family acetyltransferase involved in cellulose biosynthesis